MDVIRGRSKMVSVSMKQWAIVVLGLSLITAVVGLPVCPECQAVITVGGTEIRVQMLSSTLVRVEERGTYGAVR
jgi:hypothetical protein